MQQINQKQHPYLKHNENEQQHNTYHVKLHLIQHLLTLLQLHHLK